MAESQGRSSELIRKIIEECLRKLEILSWCPLNQELYDSNATYSIAELLRNRMQELQCIRADISESEVQQASSGSLDSDDSRLFREDSASGEDRVYYDRAEYLDRCNTAKGLSEKLRNLKYRYHNLSQTLHVESQIEMAKQRFVKSWEDSRQEQLQRSLALRVEDLQTEHTMLKQAETDAMLAVVTIEKYYDWKLSRTEQDIEEWMNRFDREKDEQDSRFQKARATEKYWNELKQMSEEHEKEILSLEIELERWEAEAKFKEFCNRMAVKLQAWWRGIMVRKGFGRFGTGGKNRAKKIKGKDKGKKKGKK